MFRRNTHRLVGMTGSFQDSSDERNNKKGWKDLFFKPQTRDERVKDYIPEVLEESLAAQRAVLAKENTERDLIVEYGQKMLKDLENKAPVTNMFPAFVSLMKLYKKDNLISQRAMHLLMYPGSTQHGTVNQQALPELVGSFSENLRAFIDSVEQNGSFVHDVKWKKGAASSKKPKQLASGSSGKEKIAGELEAGSAEKQEDGVADKSGEEKTKKADDQAVADDNTAAAEVDDSPTAIAEEAEPVDITLYVKCLAGMSMANARINDHISAVKCCDAALEHAMDPSRKGGVYALKAGLQVQQKKLLDAVQTAHLAIECAPQNPQGYLHGSTALRLMGRHEEAIKMLELASESMPGNDAIAGLLERTVALSEKTPKQLGGDTSTAAEGKGGKKIGSGSANNKKPVAEIEE